MEQKENVLNGKAVSCLPTSCVMIFLFRENMPEEIHWHSMYSNAVHVSYCQNI